MSDASNISESTRLLAEQAGLAKALKLFPDGVPQNILEKVQWLPDGKQVSFIYQGTLYIVSAEPE